MANLQKFVRDGGVLLTVDDTANFAVQYGFTPGVSVTPAQRLKIIGRGAALEARRRREPDRLRLRRQPLDLFVGRPDLRRQQHASAAAAARGGGGETAARRPGAARRTMPISRRAGRRRIRCREEPQVEPWQAAPIRDEQLRNGISIIPPAQRPRVVLRYGDARDLLVSGLLDGGTEIAQRPMVVDVPVEKGHVVLFSNNPIWRGETHGSYFLVLNAILNFDNLERRPEAGHRR